MVSEQVAGAMHPCELHMACLDGPGLRARRMMVSLWPSVVRIGVYLNHGGEQKAALSRCIYWGFGDCRQVERRFMMRTAAEQRRQKRAKLFLPNEFWGSGIFYGLNTL